MFYYLSLAAALFAIGIFGFLARQDFAGKMVALFIMLNGIFVNLAAFNRFVQTDSTTGLIFIIFALVISLTHIFLVALVLRRELSAHAEASKTNSKDTVQ